MEIIVWGAIMGFVFAFSWAVMEFINRRVLEDRMDVAAERLEEARFENRALKTAVSDVTNEMVERVQDWSEKYDSVAREERRRYEAREKKWENQVQAMAERLASIKVKAAEAGITMAEEPVPFESDPPVPYSPELFEFLSDVEQGEAKELTEEYIEVRRSQGAADVQILQELEQGEYR